MKRIITILTAAAIALLMVGCGKSAEKKSEEPTAEAMTQLHTVAPSEETPAIEWAPVDCEISLSGSDSFYLGSESFLTFALVGSSDEDCELRFAMDDSAKAMLSQQSGGVTYTVSVYDEPLKGELLFNDDYSIITVRGGYTYSEMCELATSIRGL